MPEHILRGNVHLLGDHIDTDGIIPGKYTKTLDLQTLADHVLEDVDPDFRRRLQPGDMLAAGENFGCGSSREQAPLALKTAGIAAVIARSFARIFYRNAINIGLPVIEVKDFAGESGDRVEIDLTAGRVTNLDRRLVFMAAPLPRIMMAILDAGGLVDYLRRYQDYPADIQSDSSRTMHTQR